MARIREHRFFQPDYETNLFHTLSGEMAWLLSAYEDELERVTSADEKEELQAVIRRIHTRLSTLDKMRKNLPISAESLELLLQYGNTRDLGKIAEYPNVLNKDSKQLLS